MRLTAASVLAFVFAFTPAAPSRARAADLPLDWLAQFEIAYESGDVEAYGAFLDEDFRYVSGDEALARRFPSGFGRREELSAYRRLFVGARGEDGALLPRARRLDVAWSHATVARDPEFPDDPAHVVVRVSSATLGIAFQDGDSLADPEPHALALALVARPPGESPAWACRLWLVGRALEPLALAGPGVPPGGIVAADSLAFAPAWTAIPNPSRTGAGIAYVYEVALAGERVALDLFDAAGRRVASLARGPRAAGRHVARWDGRNDAGVRAAPGVYFVRAVVGAREERSRVVVVR